VKDKAEIFLADSAAGAFGGLVPQIRNSFLERGYSPFIGMELNE
jgi:hypothetical protein